MYYKEFKGEKLSRLGMGNMRLPTVGGPMDPVDYDKAREIIKTVYDNGVNYFDTAFMYHGGDSERFLGKTLPELFRRETYNLADKMPAFMIEPGKGPDSIFEEQLRRCHTEYFDFYLCHNVNDSSIMQYEDPELGVIPYLLEQKKAGRIRHLGFSSHGSPEMLQGFLDRWDCFEFVQIQLNYLDWELQNAKRQYEIIGEHGLPVWVMEPCRGGRLASLSPEADAMLKAFAPERSVASWAFRFVQSLPNVQMILSGMTQLDQALDNLKTFDHYEPLSEEEEKTLWAALDQFRGSVNVPCTKCRYCDGCPMGLEIPELIAVYNQYCISPGPQIMMTLERMDESQRPGNCIGCGACAAKCPQGIEIPGIMSTFAEILAKFEEDDRP